MMTYTVDACRMTDKEETHAYLKETIQLPDYYGGNLDALYDCLTDMTDTQIVIKNFMKAPDYFQRVYKVIMHASSENPDLSIVVEIYN